MEKLAGACLCGVVTFEVRDDFEQFQFCHCTQCQKTTGSAHAANLFTDPENLTWKSGRESIVRYDLEGRSISNAFCDQCGSRVPYLSRSGAVLVVPAGSLNGAPSIAVQGNIFWPERAAWYEQGLEADRVDEFLG